MLSREVTIQNRIGLHARPAALFIRKASGFQSAVWIEVDNRRVNAKSLLGVLSMGLVKDSIITLIADGSDEEETLEALVTLIMYELEVEE